MTLRNFTKLSVLRYLDFCNVLHIWSIRAIPTYIESTDSMILSCSYTYAIFLFNYTKYMYSILYTVNREYFVIKIFSDSLACAKIKRTKNIRNINDNAVHAGSFVRKLFNMKIYRMKYFRHEIFAIYGNLIEFFI